MKWSVTDLYEICFYFHFMQNRKIYNVYETLQEEKEGM